MVKFGQEGRDGSANQGVLAWDEKFGSCLIGKFNESAIVNSHDCRRTGLDQSLQPRLRRQG